MLVSFECTVVGQRLKNLSDVRRLQAVKQVGALLRGLAACLPFVVSCTGLALFELPHAARAADTLYWCLPVLPVLYRSPSTCTAAASGASCLAKRCCPAMWSRLFGQVGLQDGAA